MPHRNVKNEMNEMNPNSKSLYETLGVKPDATAVELKRARRRRAEKVHPDKRGGSEQEMAAVNHAFDVLVDPARRLLYDSTGQDSQPPEEDRIRGLVMQSFLDALMKDAPNVVKGAQQFFETTKANIKKQKAEGQRAVDALKVRRDKVTTKSSLNAFHLIVDQQISQIEMKLASLDNDIENIEKAEKELKSYKSSEKLVETYSDLQMRGWGTASTGGQW